MFKSDFLIGPGESDTTPEEDEEESREDKRHLGQTSISTRGTSIILVF